jgi:hypothetical protein
MRPMAFKRLKLARLLTVVIEADVFYLEVVHAIRTVEIKRGAGGRQATRCGRFTSAG